MIPDKQRPDVSYQKPNRPWKVSKTSLDGIWQEPRSLTFVRKQNSSALVQPTYKKSWERNSIMSISLHRQSCFRLRNFRNIEDARASGAGEENDGLRPQIIQCIEPFLYTMVCGVRSLLRVLLSKDFCRHSGIQLSRVQNSRWWTVPEKQTLFLSSYLQFMRIPSLVSFTTMKRCHLSQIFLWCGIIAKQGHQ